MKKLFVTLALLLIVAPVFEYRKKVTTKEEREVYKNAVQCWRKTRWCANK